MNTILVIFACIIVGAAITYLAATLMIFPGAFVEKCRHPTPENAKNKLIMVDDKIAVYASQQVFPFNKVILFSHGNAQVLADYDEHDGGHFCSPGVIEAQILAKLLGMTVVTYDYPGYGCSKGWPTEKSCIDAAERVMRWLDCPPEQVTLMGHSLGTGPTLALAASHPTVADVWLMAPFTSVLAVPFRIGFGKLDLFDNKAQVQKINRIINIVHGDKDDIINAEHTQRLCKASHHCRYMILDDVGHNDIMLSTQMAALFMSKHIIPRKLSTTSTRL